MIGGGDGAFIGSVHRHAMALDGHYELVCGAFSRNRENNHETANKLGLSTKRAYDSWQTLLTAEQALNEDERMQVLVIVTPNHLHVPISTAALEAGFHVFCEKPAGINTQEVQALKETLSGSQGLYGLAHTYIGYPMVWQARHMVQTGRLGTLRKVFVEYPQGWLSQKQEDNNKQASWRTDPAQSGASGCMGDIGTHAFGLAEFISTQHVTRLCAHMQTHVEGRRLDDDGAALFSMDGDASGVLMASQVCLGEENALKIRLYGDKGALEWSQMEPNSLLFRSADEPYQVFRAGQGQPGLCEEASQRCRLPAGHPEGYLEAMANLYSYFAQAVRAGNTGTASGVPGLDSGLRGMKFIDTMLASSNSEQKWHSL